MTEEEAKTSVLFATIPTFIFVVVFIIDLYCSIYMHVRILFSAFRKDHLNSYFLWYGSILRQPKCCEL